MSVDGQGAFAGSGAVGRYWQTRCRGFEVLSARGRRLGTVEALELDRETRTVVVLVVGRRRRGPMRLRAEAVGSIDPWRQSLVVSVQRRRRPTVPVARIAARTGRASAASGVLVARGARRTASFSAHSATAGARGARRAGSVMAVAAAALSRGARRAGRAVAWAVPRLLFVVGLAAWLYALVVFTLVRLVLRLLVALTTGTARGGARIGPHLHGAK